MARGLSPLQKDILRVFNQCHSALTTQEILMRLYFDPCPRSSPEVVTNTVRRALTRLWDRGLVIRIFGRNRPRAPSTATATTIRPIWFPTAVRFMRSTEPSFMADGNPQREPTGTPSQRSQRCRAARRTDHLRNSADSFPATTRGRLGWQPRVCFSVTQVDRFASANRGTLP